MVNESVFSVLRIPCCNNWDISDPQLIVTLLSRVSYRHCLAAVPRFEGCLIILQIKPLPLLESKQQQKVAAWHSRLPENQPFPVRQTGKHLHFSHQCPLHSLQYRNLCPMCNSEVTAFGTGKYHWMEMIALQCLASYSCTVNTWQKCYSDLKKWS